MLPALAFILLLLFAPVASAQRSGAFSKTAPELPRLLTTTINSANFPDLFPAVVNKTVKASGGDYTSLTAAFAAISSVAPNCSEIITVDAGYTSDALGLNQILTYPVIACPAGKHIWVRSSGYTSLPAQGTRVGSADKANMFKVTKSTTNVFDGMLSISDGASGLLVTGIDLEASGNAMFFFIQAGSSTNSSNYCNHIYFDRSYIDTTYATLVNHAIIDGCSSFAFTDSVVDHINVTHASTCSTYSESHGVIAYNAKGPIKLVNNYWGGAPTENVFFGGAVPAVNGTFPTDIEIRRNTIVKDTGQLTNSVIKNLLEFKSGVRVLVDGNTLQYSYNDPLACGGQQSGQAMDFVVQTAAGGDVNSTGPNNLVAVSDVTFTNNDVQHFNSWMSLVGHQVTTEQGQWPETARMQYINNLFRDVNKATYDVGGANISGANISGSNFAGWSARQLRGPHNVSINNNGFYGTSGNGAYLTYINVIANVSCAQFGFVAPNWTLNGNVTVLDTTHLNGDCYIHTSDFLNVGVFPNLNVGSNVFFNFEVSSGSTCSNWNAFNPGICPPGLASSPATINFTLGIADYATCAAGNTNISVSGAGSGDLSKCVITGANAGVGPNIAAIQAAQIEPNDSLKWGPRDLTPFTVGIPAISGSGTITGAGVIKNP